MRARLLAVTLLALVPSCVIYTSRRAQDSGVESSDEDDGIRIHIGGKSEKSGLDRVNQQKNIGPFSDAVGAGGFLFLSGVIPRDNASGEVVRGDVAAATRKVMENIGQTLKTKGLGYDDIVMVTIYLRDLSDYDVVNQTYAEFFQKGRTPARATVQVSRLALDADMEIAVVAYRANK
ncbi:MAG: RidA family protein [Planctomycetes bacterium]|nr:RidA family protein [Planctomycetota bacterium]